MIVTCGEALVDLVPDAVAGGGPMNVAIAAARLGAPSAFVGGISNDEHGDMLWKHLADNSVDTRLCRRYDASTARAIVEHIPELRFRFEGDQTADTLLAEADLSILPPGPHIVHGGTLGLFRGRTAETLARLVENHHGLVSLDPNIRPQIIDDRDRWDHFHQRWLPHTDIYKASDEDLAWIWPNRSTDSAVREVLGYGVSAVIVTSGAKGLTVVTASGEIQVGAPTIDPIDTVGAGDTTVAVFLTCVADLTSDPETRLVDIALSDWKTIAQRAAAAAAITCSRVGADPPHRIELDG